MSSILEHYSTLSAKDLNKENFLIGRYVATNFNFCLVIKEFLPFTDLSLTSLDGHEVVVDSNFVASKFLSATSVSAQIVFIAVIIFHKV